MTSTIGMDPYFLATQTQMPYDAYAQYYAQLLAGAQQNQNTQTATSNVTFQGSQPQVKRAVQEKNSGAGTAIALGTIATLGAVALFGHSSGKQVLQKLGKEENFFKTTWTGIKSWFKKDGSEAVSEAVENAAGSTRNVSRIVSREGNEALQGYTIMANDGSQIFVNDKGKVVKIVAKNKKQITDPDKINSFMNDNNLSTKINNFDLNNELPKGVKLSYTKEVSSGKRKYKITVEDGKVVKVLSKDNNDIWHEVPEKDLNGFVNNHVNVVNEAKTLSNTEKRKFKIWDNDKKEFVEMEDDLTISVRDGKIVSAKQNGTALTQKELEQLNKDYSSELSSWGNKFGANKYSDKIDVEYTYRANGGNVIRFDKNKQVISITSMHDQTWSTSDEISKYLENNAELNTSINNIINNGQLPSGFNLTDLVYKIGSGHEATFVNGQLNSLKLAKEFTYNGRTYKAGETISGKVLKNWQKQAENADDVAKINELLK